MMDEWKERRKEERKGGERKEGKREGRVGGREGRRGGTKGSCGLFNEYLQYNILTCKLLKIFSWALRRMTC